MIRHAAVRLVSLAAAAGGVLAAHAVAYAVAAPDGAGGHGYLAFAEALVCAALALGLVAAVGSARHAPLGRPAAWPFAVVPPLAFLLQEWAERGFASPFEPVVLLGLALQLPAALLAYSVARLLLRAAEALAGAPERPATAAAAAPAEPHPGSVPRPVRARLRSPRAPPRPLAA